jgi:hypothetical protein
MSPDKNVPAEVTPQDVTRLLGDLDTETLIAIMELKPTFADLEEAALRIAGNGEAIGRLKPAGVVAEILDLVDFAEEEEPGRGPVPT